MRTILSLLFCLIAGAAWASEDKVGLVAPSVLPGVISEMRTPGFWVARHPAPDDLVLSDKSIAELNSRIEGQGLTENLARFPKVLDGVKVRQQLSEMIEGLKKKTLYGTDGKVVSPGLVAAFNREVDAIPDKVEVLFGFIVKPVDMRLLPMREPLYSELGEVDFDEVQNSGLETGTPVVVWTHSRDRKWLFVQDAISAGWVATDGVARCSYDLFRKRINPERPLVITSAKADIFLDHEMTEYLTTVRMGTGLSFKSTTASSWEVEVPAVDADGQVKFVPAYIAKREASPRPLPYTPRTIYEQAFKLLDAPYGWGDMNGGQDCSRFMQMVFASAGIKLPRNSAEQVRVGAMLPGFKEGFPAADKASIIVTKGLGAATILGLKGHIMLYLGSYNDKPYVIHSTWSYREPLPDGTQRARIIGRVAVTSLNLGSGTNKGSLGDRVIAARILE